jgi:Co/Zn/Cd efflux system component
VGLLIGSAALIADAVDFLEDTGVYLLGAVAVGWSARRRAEVGLFMAAAMGAVGLTALWQVVDRLLHGGTPASAPMAATAAVALAVNVFCATRLAPWKRGDASMRSIWLSTRNDAVLNGVTIVAAGLIVVVRHPWPDLAAGLLIAGINLQAAGEVAVRGWRERRAA